MTPQSRILQAHGDTDHRGPRPRQESTAATPGRSTRITFDVAPGELFGFLGPNGAGKTTTIRILSTLLRPDRRARPAWPASTWSTQPHEVRERLGLAMQTPTLDAFSTGRETLELAGRLHRLPAGEIRRRADELLELMGLASVAKKLTGTYSGGMKRRLDLASALMHRPPLLILDEPTEGLDPQSRTALWEELERISAEGTTMLLTTHYMEEADRLCSRLAIVDNGRIVVEGRPGELKESVGADTVVLQLESGNGDDKRRRPRAVCSRTWSRRARSWRVHAGGVTLAVPNANVGHPRAHAAARRQRPADLRAADEPAEPRRRVPEVHRPPHPRRGGRPADHHGVVTIA